MGTGLIIAGRKVLVPGRDIVNYLDDKTLALPKEDGRRRPDGTKVSLIVLHTTKGIPGGKDQRKQDIRPGMGPNVDAEHRTNRWWSTSDKQSGAHLVVDLDGSGGCLADCAAEMAFHAKAMNLRSVGIEIYQGSDAELYRSQIDAVIDIVNVLTIEFGIQRQIPDRYRGPVGRLAKGGEDCYGVVGHRDGDDNRGEGDPGNYVFDALEARGYERVNYATGEDRTIWRTRQKMLNERHGAKLLVDGVPGKKTRDALAAAGYPHGLWALAPRAPTTSRI